MISRYVMYNPAKKGITHAKLRKLLPKHIEDELCKDARLFDYLWIDCNKKEAVREIDRIFNIPKSRDVTKDYHVEVTEDDIHQFSYYNIGIKTVDYGRAYDAALNRSTCDTPDCPSGVFMYAPYLINNQKLQNLDIAELWGPLVNEVQVMVSAHLKSIFEANGITGLEYEKCDLKKSLDQDRPIYFARIRGRGSAYADDILINRWRCKRHNMPGEYVLYNYSHPDALLAQEDVQLITKVQVKNNEYTLQMPEMYFSTRVLKIILNLKRRNLQKLGFFLGQPFIPIAPEKMIRGE